MPLSYETVSGNGVTTNFAIPFQFLDKAHVHVLVDDAEILSHTWINSSTIQILPAPPSGTLNVEFRRTTPRDVPLVDFENGSTLFDTDLDKVNLQALFIAQEMFEQAQNITFPSGHAIDSHSDSTPGETRAKGSLRVFDENSLTKAVTLADGSLLVGDNSDPRGVRALALGNLGDTLEVDTSVSGKVAWKQGLRKIVTAAGDLLVASADEALARLGVGATNRVLVADAAEALKMAWKDTLTSITINSTTLNSCTFNSGGVNTATLTGCALAGGGTINGTFTGTYTLASPTITGNTVGLNAIKTATGSASGTVHAANPSDVVAINEYPLGYNVRTTSVANGGSLLATIYAGANNNDYVPLLDLIGVVGAGGWAANYTLQWRYFTATDNPVVWVSFNPETGAVQSVWASDDPIVGDVPGIYKSSGLVRRFTAKDFEHLTALSEKASEAAAMIRDSKRRMAHQAYRAMQLVSGQSAPSQWILENCVIDLSTKRIAVVK
jgi:hypothetical protein